MFGNVFSTKQCKINNKYSLQPTLSEAERADVESFLLDILYIFPLLGLSVFEKTETATTPDNLLYSDSKGIEASGPDDAKGFVSRAGSWALQEEVLSNRLR